MVNGREGTLVAQGTFSRRDVEGKMSSHSTLEGSQRAEPSSWDAERVDTWGSPQACSLCPLTAPLGNPGHVLEMGGSVNVGGEGQGVNRANNWKE